MSTQTAEWSDRDHAIASIISSLESSNLWQCYFHDFIKVKCTQSDAMLPEETNLSPVLSTYFNYDQKIAENEHFVSRLAWLHVHSEVYKTDLNQMIDKLKRLKEFIIHQPLASVTNIIVTDYTEKNLETLIIKRSHASLHDIVDDQDALKYWYKLFSDIVRKSTN